MPHSQYEAVIVREDDGSLTFRAFHDRHWIDLSIHERDFDQIVMIAMMRTAKKNIGRGYASKSKTKVGG